MVAPELVLLVVTLAAGVGAGALGDLPARRLLLRLRGGRLDLDVHDDTHGRLLSDPSRGGLWIQIGDSSGLTAEITDI
jgi:hypothetical protein